VVPGAWIIVSSLAASLLGGFAYHFLVEKRAVAKKANPEVFIEPLPKPLAEAQRS
jgi:peptidoglycan/LPS O-acetylase OafA/YrhL